MKPIIEVKGLSKRYKLGVFNAKTLREEAEAFLSRFSRRNAQTANGDRHAASGLVTGNSSPATAQPSSDFWALRDVSFDVQPGEVIGVIGRNGAGKSTLLKILSRITEPTSGEARIRGRVASLLEVGTGFHPELTGRENIFLNGAILGMTKQEIRNKFDEIVAFAEIEKFIDTPVKRYSSGMYVRLAFAVAAHLEPEILIVDEVLAVGDAAFQKKCLGKMQEVSGRDGRTVLFVSHNIGAVQALCSRALFLVNGQLKALGPTEEICRSYMDILAKQGASVAQGVGPLKNEVRVEEVAVKDSGGHLVNLVSRDSGCLFEVTLESEQCLDEFQCFLAISSSETRLMTMRHAAARVALPAGASTLHFRLPPRFLRPGVYQIGIGCINKSAHEWMWTPNFCSFEIIGHWDDVDDKLEEGLIQPPVNSASSAVAKANLPSVAN